MRNEASFVRTIILSIGLTLLIGALTLLGVFRDANLWVMDISFDTFAADLPTPDIVLVALSHQKQTESVDKTRLLNIVAAAKPASLHVILDSPMELVPWQRAFEGLSQPIEQTGIAVSLVEKGQEQLRYLGPTTVLAGHHRQWQAVADDNQTRAFQLALSTIQASKPSIIDFTAGAFFLPKVQDAQVVGETLPDQVFSNKHVLIGHELISGQPGYSVPFDREKGISLSELQGYILASALEERFIEPESIWLAVPITALLLLVSLIALQWIEFWGASLLVLLGLGASVLANYFAIAWMAQMLPVAQWFAASAFALFIVYQQKQKKEQSILKQVVAEMDARLSERIIQTHFNQTEQPWSQIINFVFQQLNLNKSIFLEKVPKDHRVREIIAINCELNDIEERRRDYLRAPYSDAMDAGKPTKPFRPYFSQQQEGEDEYLAPLNFGGEVLGFWAAAVSPGENWNQKAFESNMRSYADQVAELLYHRKHWQKQERWLENFWVRVFSFEAGERLHSRIKQSVQLLENRMDTLEKVFNHLSTASVLYNVFGQVLHTNLLMERLASQNNVKIFGRTATEALAHFTGYSLDDAKKKIRYVVLKHQSVTLEAGGELKGGSHILHVRPILAETEEDEAINVPFKVLGILFEFIDVGSIRQMMSFRKNLMQQYFHVIRNDLATLGMAATQLKSSPSQEMSTKLIELMEERIKQTSQKTLVAEQEVEQFSSVMKDASATVNATSILIQVVQDLAADFEEKSISIVQQIPGLSSLAVIEPSLLQQFLRVAFWVLIDDATHESEISVNLVEEASTHHLRLTIINHGHGLDERSLQSFLESGAASYVDESDPKLVQLGSLIYQLRVVGVRVDVQSQIGSGFTVDAILPVFRFLG